ncbi:MAG: ParB/RepB/Spo0J family partition protein [Proteobacteria bacterium]|nr:ParB/RepB/Spo0J family partition protein [Pseudomonadota bacterium]
MTELRTVDPRTIKPNPHNPRTVAAPPHMEQELIASIRAIGIIQPPVVRIFNGDLVVKAGDRRVKAAIAADLATIEVLVKDADESTTHMESLSENAIRAPMHQIDIWRGVKQLEERGWNEQSIADALAQPLRIVKRVKLLAHIHEPMLDAMASNQMPSDEHLRTIANASVEEQAQVWKKHKPGKNKELSWWTIASALSKRHIPFSAAKFGDDLAAQFGVIWHEDLFVQGNEDGRYTTDVDGFFGAQQEWLENNLPKNGVILQLDNYGQAALPKKAERVYGKAGKGDIIGHFLDPRTAEVKTVAYRMPPEKKAAKGDGKDATPLDAPSKTQRPAVTQKGHAIIGDLRTDALHETLRADPLEDITLVSLLVIAFGGRNVSVQSGLNESRSDRTGICENLMPGGKLTLDNEAIRSAAREMLTQVLSCRDNMSNSGIVARVAGDAIGAALRLPSMATDEFLSCLSRQALEQEASTVQVPIQTRVKDTRAALVKHFDGATWIYPDAGFAVTTAELEALSAGPEDFSFEDAGSTENEPDHSAEEGLEDDEATEMAHAAD